MAAPVPAVSNAAIQAVKDPQVRAVLRAMADNQAVRAGEVGSGDQAYLTMADIKGDAGLADRLAAALAAPIVKGILAPGKPLSQLGQELQDAILRSPAWQEMFTRITLLDAPDSIPGSTANLLLTEAKARKAAVTTVSQAVQTTNESLAQTSTTLTTAIGANAAAIQTEQRARTTADESLTQQISTVVTQTGTAFSGVYSQLSTATNNSNALADAVNVMWSRFGSNGALISGGANLAVNNVGSVVTQFDQLQATVTDPVTGLVATSAALRSDWKVVNDKVTGLSGKWGVKLDLNGYVTGVALNSGVSTGGVAESSFLVLADTFAVGAPGKPGIVPFAIDAKTGLVAIKGDLLASGSVSASQLAATSVDRSKIALRAVGGAQIDDLAVDTLKIGRNAVTIPLYVSGGGGLFSAGQSRQVGSVSAFYPDSVEIVALVSWLAAAPGTGGNTGVELRVDGSTFHYASDSNINSYALSHATSGKVSLGAGYHTFTIHFDNNWSQGQYELSRWSVTLLGVMR